MPSPFDLDGRVAIVTGASRGLGHAIALALAEAGARVALAARDEAALEGVRAEIEGAGGRSMPLQVDITNRATVDRMVQRVVDSWGRIDILVNNAGIVQVKPFVEVTEEDFMNVLNINLMGMYRCTQAAGRIMIGQGRGKIINISSSAGIRGRSLEVPYSSSKGAVNMFTLSLAVEWARYNINVNAVCPAYFDTPLNAKALEDENLRKTIEKRIPFRRIGLPAELAPTIVYLAAPASDYVTGQVIAVDGGTTCK